LSKDDLSNLGIAVTFYSEEVFAVDRKINGYKPPNLSVEKTKDFIIIPSPWL